jgi:hypothetical protein
LRSSFIGCALDRAARLDDDHVGVARQPFVDRDEVERRLLRERRQQDAGRHRPELHLVRHQRLQRLRDRRHVDVLDVDAFALVEIELRVLAAGDEALLRVHHARGVGDLQHLRVLRERGHHDQAERAQAEFTSRQHGESPCVCEIRR